MKTSTNAVATTQFNRKPGQGHLFFRRAVADAKSAAEKASLAKAQREDTPYLGNEVSLWSGTLKLPNGTEIHIQAQGWTRFKEYRCIAKSIGEDGKADSWKTIGEFTLPALGQFGYSENFVTIDGRRYKLRLHRVEPKGGKPYMLLNIPGVQTNAMAQRYMM